jgi:DNA helicase-2/ATP-dependent DNA helicase PcrA
MEPVRKEAGPVLCIEHDHVSDEANWLAEQIRSLVDSGICNYSDIAILLRSVSTSGPEIADALKHLGIPFLVGGKIGLFQRDEAQAVGRIFAWCADMFWWVNPYTKESVEGDDLINSALELWPGVADRDDIEEFKYEIRSGTYKCLTEAYQSLLLLLGFLSLDPSDPLDTAIMANLGRFNTLLVDFESAQRRGGSKPNWSQDLKSLAWFINTYAAGAYEEQPSDDLRGLDAVQLMTVHQAKGLEWPVVFVPALTQDRFPSSMAGRSRDWFVSTDLFDKDRYEGGIEAERKLFYVAITRARDALVLSFFQRIHTARPTSRFVDETGIESSVPASTPVTNKVFKEIGDEEEIVTFTAGDIIEFLRCPYFYRLREIWGFKPTLAELLGYGKSIHHILRRVSEGSIAGKDPLELLDSTVEEGFHLPYANQAQAVIMKQNAKKALLNYIKARLDEIRSTKEVESRLEFRLTKRATIAGRIDAIFDQDGTIEVRDYKTTDDERTEDETALQVCLYSLGLKDVGQPAEKGAEKGVKSLLLTSIAHIATLKT